MRAILIDEPGEPDRMYIGEAPEPMSGPRDVLVRSRATALNRADTLQRRGRYEPPPGKSRVMGLEVAGDVERVGDDVHEFAPGDRVMALLAGGGYAELVAVPEGHLMRIPPNLSYEEAAAIPEVFLTAYQALYWLGNLKETETVLIHAGASGVGTAAIQLAVDTAATVAVTAGSEEKLGTCKALGAHIGINYREGAFDAPLLTATDQHGADVIIDFIGAPYWRANVNALAFDGRIVLLAFMGGAVIDQFDMRKLFKKRGALITSTLRSRSDEYKTALTKAFADSRLQQFESGKLRPVIDTIFDWSDAAEAHTRMEANLNAGKIVLRIS